MPGSPNQLADESDADHYFNATNRLTNRLRAAQAVLAIREGELLTLKGPCGGRDRRGSCRLHYAHSGPCDITEKNP